MVEEEKEGLKQKLAASEEAKEQLGATLEEMKEERRREEIPVDKETTTVDKETTTVDKETTTAEKEETSSTEQEDETESEEGDNAAHTNYLLNILGDTSDDPLGILPLPHTQIQSMKDEIIHLRTRLADQEK